MNSGAAKGGMGRVIGKNLYHYYIRPMVFTILYSYRMKHVTGLKLLKVTRPGRLFYF